MMQRYTQGFSHNSYSLRSDDPIPLDQIKAVAPSIFAEQPHENRSEKYTYIPTSAVLAGLQKEGFEPFFVCQAKPRDRSREDFTKHMIRLRHAAQINNDEANEIILVNSHDGTSSYQLLGGVFRFVCANGLISGDTVGHIRIPHRGDVVDSVIEGAYQVLDEFERIDESKDSMKAVDLTEREQQAFARAAIQLRFDTDPDKPAPVTENDVIRPRRYCDARDDLWTVFNTVQENLVKGGLRSYNHETRRRTTTREVKGIDGNVKLNQALWVLAEEMRKLKAAA